MDNLFLNYRYLLHFCNNNVDNITLEIKKELLNIMLYIPKIKSRTNSKMYIKKKLKLLNYDVYILTNIEDCYFMDNEMQAYKLKYHFDRFYNNFKDDTVLEQFIVFIRNIFKHNSNEYIYNLLLYQKNNINMIIQD